jgi:tetratricopeptide (TPR) repeat protein
VVAAAALSYHRAAPAAATKSVALALVGLCALGLTLPRLLDRRQGSGWRLSRPLLAWLALCAWYGFSATWSDHRATEQLAVLSGAAGVGVAASTLPMATVRHSARVAAVILGGISSLAWVVQWLLGARGMGLHGLQGNPNWLGLLLAATMPLQLELLVEARRRGSRWRRLWTATGVLTLLTIVLSASRVSWVALMVTGVVFAGGRWRKEAMAAAAVAAAALTALGGDLAASLAGRWWLWTVSANAAIDALPLGAGAGDFAQVFLDAQGELLARLPTERAALQFVNATTAHNDWLEAAAVGGPTALILLAATIALAVVELRRSWRAGAAAVVVVAICAIGDSPMAQPSVLAMLALILAAAPRRSLRRGFMTVHAGTLAVLIVVLPQATTRWMSHRAVAAAQEAAIVERTPRLEAAHRQDPSSGEVTLRLGLWLLETGDAARALPWLEHSRQHFANLGTDVALGNCWIRLERPDRAAIAYRRALRRHPAYFRAHANLVEALRLLGRLERAEQHLRTARQLQPGHPKLARMAERLRRTRIDAATNR